jgi:hypothetical protein
MRAVRLGPTTTNCSKRAHRLFQVDLVCIHNSCYVCCNKQVAWGEFSLDRLQAWRFGRVIVRPVEKIAAILDTVPTHERPGSLVEFGELTIKILVKYQAACSGRRGLLRIQFCIVIVEVYQCVGDALPFTLVCFEYLAMGESLFDQMDFPRKVMRVQEGSVHPLTGFWL